MSLTFRALEIGSGDAFLLEDDSQRILFDSGGSKSILKSILKRKQCEHIHIAICSHNDVDHTNGFLGLLDSSDIQIDEIWLPMVWASLLQFIQERWREIAPWEIDDWRPMNDNQQVEFVSLFQEGSVSVEDFDDNLSYFSRYESSDISHELYIYHYHWRRGFSYGHDLVLKLENIFKIATAAYQKGSLIRWFEPTSMCQCNSSQIQNGLLPLNSQETRQIRKIKDVVSFFQALCLTDENRYSLVFEYLRDGIPVVRFSADSDCICQSQSPYNKNIIVTAPHHGSDANAQVYTSLQGNDIIWVRSDRKSRKRPCQNFKNMANRYCLVCKLPGMSKSEICFDYDDIRKQWRWQSGCQCHGVC